MEKNYFHNLRLAPQEKNSDFQEAVLHLIISERKRRLIRDKLLQRRIPGVCFHNKILVKGKKRIYKSFLEITEYK